jgi:RNA polymerase sigma-70 factor, ECF subfamily
MTSLPLVPAERQPTDASSDAALVQQVLRGDTHAYASLVRAHQDAQFRTALRLTGSRDDAHDALQSAFVRAHRHLAACDDPARFGAWLSRIVVNECRTLVARRAQREKKLVRDDLVISQLAAPVATSHAIDEDIEHALSQLPHEQREAFVLKYVEELGYDEMAALTGVGVSALKMRVKRACEKLRTLIVRVPHD